MTAHHKPDRSTPGALAVALVFAIVITLPGLGLALGLDRATISESERRELAAWPAVPSTVAEAAAWPSAFQKYFEDHFLLRTRLIDWRSGLLWNFLDTSGSKDVIVGKQNWLFYAADGGIDDWTQSEPFTDGELEVWRDTLLRRRAFLSARGIRYLFVIAPDKQMVYPELMPATLHRLHQEFKADQLIAFMHRSVPDFEFLDLRPALAAARAANPGELLYHRYDTHWNDRGGLIASQAIAVALQRWLPSIYPLERRDFDTSPDVPSGDRTSMLGLPADSDKAAMPGLVPRGGWRYQVVTPQRPDPYGEDGLIVTEHRDRSLPRLVMFRDSFAGRLIPYLSEHFSRASYFWQNEFDFEAIEHEKPDVVIQEFVARHFVTWVPYPGIIPQ